MTDLDGRIGETLRVLRGDVSQAELAEKMVERGFPKWSQSTVWTIEKGTRPLRLSEAKVLTEILGCSLNALLDAPEVQKVEKALWTLYGAATTLGTAVIEYQQAREDALICVAKHGEPQNPSLPLGHMRFWLESSASEAVADVEKGGDGELRLIFQKDGGMTFDPRKMMGWPDVEHPEA